VLAVVVVVALLVRTGGQEDGTLSVEEARETGEVDAPEAPAVPGARAEPDVPRTVRLHALNTASLQGRVAPLPIDLEGGTLRTAVSGRGRGLLAVAVAEDEGGGRVTAILDVLDAATLRHVAALGRVRGPLEHLAISSDGTAVVWLQPAGPDVAARIHRVPLDPGRATAVTLPAGFAVRELRALRSGLVAVAGDAAGPDGPVATVLLHDARADGSAPVAVVALPDVGPLLATPGGRGGVAASPALAWDVDRQRLHVATAGRDGLVSVELVAGTVAAQLDDDDLSRAGAVRRQAAFDPKIGVVVTGTLIRPAGRSGLDLNTVLPLGAMVIDADGGGILAREEAQAARVVAAAGGVAVLAAGGPGRRGSAATDLRPVDASLQPVGPAFAVTGEVVVAEIDGRGRRLTAVSETPQGVVVSIHRLATGELVEERMFAPGSVVHPRAMVVVEPAGDR
jgi:hypothetical protein